MKKFVFAIVVVAGFSGMTAEASAQDPRIDRMITLLERMTDRMDRIEQHVYGGGGGGGSYSQPAAYRNVSYQPASYGGYNDTPLRLRNSSNGYQQISNGQVQRMSSSGMGGNNEIVIRVFLQ